MNATTTLAELATTHPGASRVFHRLGLDFCCGGRRPLADVCRDKGLDAAAVLREIEGEPCDLPRWDTKPLDELITFIVERYHESLRSELPALIAMAEKVETKHGDKPSCPKGLKAHLEAIYVAVLHHLAKEETILFPIVLSGHGAMASAPIRVMEEEHDEHGQNLAHTRVLTDNLTPPEEACPTWRALYLRLEQLEADLMDHIHLENNVLFPRALAEMGAGR